MDDKAHAEIVTKLRRERDEALAEVERLRKSVEDWHDAAVRAERNAAMSQDEALAHINEVERLRQCCTQRGARLQIMREWMREFPAYSHRYTTMWDQFAARKDALPWFDDNGVPVGGEGE